MQRLESLGRGQKLPLGPMPGVKKLPIDPQPMEVKIPIRKRPGVSGILPQVAETEDGGEKAVLVNKQQDINNTRPGLQREKVFISLNVPERAAELKVFVLGSSI